MKSTPWLKITSFLFCLFLLSSPVLLNAQDFPPKSNTLVTDFTGTLSTSERQNLESKLVAFDDSSSTQIAVVILSSVGDYEIADYGVRLAQQWGIGTKGKDNGILLLVAKDDRKVTIQTGYGVEGAVPDAIAFQIIRGIITPAFREERYYEGLNRATDALIAYTKGEFKADPKKEPKGNSGGLVFIVILIVVVIAFLANRGGRGGGGQIIDGRGASDLFWLSMLSGLGRDGRRGGGFGGGGSFGGGGGGGFGGFGGGSFGGGGASGSW